MDDINSVTLLGRLTGDPELRSTWGGTDVCSFRLAFNTSKKSGDGWEDHSNFIGVTVWGRQGESVSRYTKKGSQVAVKGRLEFREWETDSGAKRSTIEVVADKVQFIGPRDDDSSSSRAPRQESRSQHRPAAVDDDIPF